MAHKRISYQDFMLMALPGSGLSRWRRLTARRPARRGRFYPTGLKKLPGNRVEVTFCLPPETLRQMAQAVTSGHKIRLFVPR